MAESVPISKRSHKSAEQREKEILFAAFTIFSRRGYQAADVESIAEMAGVGKGTVYRYFPSKEELFKATLHNSLDRLRCYVEDRLVEQTEPLARLRAIMAGYITYFEDNPDTLELFAQERAEFRDKTSSVYVNRMYARRDDWKTLFIDIKERYPVRKDIEIDDMMDVCADLMHGATLSQDLSMARKPAHERLETIFRFFLHGISEAGRVDEFLNE